MIRKRPTKDWDHRVKAMTKKYEECEEKKPKDPIQVYTRCVFDRIIEIDTKGERFDADVIVESTWQNDQVLKVLLTPQFDKDYHSEYFYLNMHLV
jgi:hypothetical protein